MAVLPKMAFLPKMALLHPNLSNPLLPISKPSQRSPRKPSAQLSCTRCSPLSSFNELGSPPLLEFPDNKPAYSQDKNAATPSRPSLMPLPDERKRDFYFSLGVCVGTLRHDILSLFSKDPNYGMYREDITFIDPLNTFQGIENYRLFFRALRFHGRILFREIKAELFRIWQPSENSIWIRWEIRGVPRVPWEAEGRFQGTSRYRVDRNGMIYEHKVDNLAFNLPQNSARSAIVPDFFATAFHRSPNLSFWADPYEEMRSSSWTQLYRAVWRALVHEAQFSCCAGFDGLVGFS